MSQEVLLLNDIEKLGKTGDVVKVADGYARNYLLPQGLAAPVTNHAMRRLEKIRKEREETNRIRLAEAKDKAAKLRDTSVTLRAKVVDGTRLYGSVGAIDIVNAIDDGLKVSVDKNQIDLAEPLKETGAFDIPIVLHADVKVTVKVWVVAD